MTEGKHKLELRTKPTWMACPGEGLHLWAGAEPVWMQKNCPSQGFAGFAQLHTG